LRHLAGYEWGCTNAECPRRVGERVRQDNGYTPGEWELCIYCDGQAVVTSDADCAPRAVEQVRRWGGVLEHPAGSKLWEHCGLPLPTSERDPEGACPTRWADSFGGYTIELDQVEWGHPARKRTWLYLVGVPRSALEAPPFPGREPTRRVSGRRGRPTQAKHPAWAEQLPRCSDTERRRTPPLFAEYLVRLARQAVRP
jgi:hypothetical protein